MKWMACDLLRLLALFGTLGFWYGRGGPVGAFVEEAGAAAGAGEVSEVSAGFVGELGEELHDGGALGGER